MPRPCWNRLCDLRYYCQYTLSPVFKGYVSCGPTTPPSSSVCQTATRVQSTPRSLSKHGIIYQRSTEVSYECSYQLWSAYKLMRRTEIQSRSSAAKVLRATWAPSASQRAWARGASSWHEEGRRVSLWQAAVDSQRCRRARRLQSAAPASHAAALRTDRGYRVLLSSQRAAAALLARTHSSARARATPPSIARAPPRESAPPTRQEPAARPPPQHTLTRPGVLPVATLPLSSHGHTAPHRPPRPPAAPPARPPARRRLT